MPYKFRKQTSKKNAEQKKVIHLVDVRTLRSFMYVKKLRLVSVSRPRAITTTTRGLTKEQADLLKKLVAKGLLPQITWIESDFKSFDDKIKYALHYLHSDEAESLGCKIIKGYDYAWIKIALERGPIPERYTAHRYMTTPKFVEFIRFLGFYDIAGSKTLNKYIAQAKWHSQGNRLSFDNTFISNQEIRRRNLIALKFLEIMNEI